MKIIIVITRILSACDEKTSVQREAEKIFVPVRSLGSKWQGYRFRDGKTATTHAVSILNQKHIALQASS
ncbi:hypothetical protein LEC72_24915 [Salmonella enterica]|nr:hypothetical protein [Salmonella enterica]